MIEIGRVCVKTAGRDAGLKCVVIDIDKELVLIDGQTRRRKCNIAHLEPTKDVLKIKKGASHADVVSAFKELKIEIKERKTKEKTARPKKVRKKKAPKKEKKGKKKEVKVEKKEEAKEEKKATEKEEPKKEEKVTEKKPAEEEKKEEKEEKK